MAPENSIVRMPDHITTHDLPFLSRSGPGWGQKNVIEENFQLFQDIVPLNEAVAPDSYPDETQCQLEYDTEVIKEVDCIENETNNPITVLEKEVALDSEDEPDCGVEKFKAHNRKSEFRIVKRNRIGVFKTVSCSPFLQLKGPLADQQFGTGSNVIAAEEPEKSSQDNALDFVDSYLSLHKVVFSPKPNPRDVCEKVTPASGLKGCQSLARQISNRNPDRKEETFKWVDVYLEKSTDSKEACGLNNQSWFSDSRNATGSRKQIKKIKQLFPVSIEKNRVTMEQDSDACDMETDKPDLFDVGIGTQMAAEAMEALSNGFSTDKTASQHSENLFVGSPIPVAKTKRANSRMSSQRKSFTRNRISSSYLKQSSDQDLDNGPTKTTKRKSSKFMAGRLTRKGNTFQNNCSTGLNLNPVKKRKESELESKYKDKKCQDHQSLPLPCGNNSPGKHCLQRESFDYQTGNGMKYQKVEGTKDESHNEGGTVNNISKRSIITYKRKRTGLKNKPSMASDAGISCKQLEQKETFSDQAEPLVAGCEMARTKDETNIPQQQERAKDIGKICIITYQRRKRLCNAKSEVATSEGKKSLLWPLASSYYFRTWNSTKGKRTIRKRRSHSNAVESGTNLLVVFDAKKDYRKPCNKIVPKSSILKELVKLGIPDQEPEFKMKHSRKRRDIASVRVLFSQHLDDDIIKHQKRILARFHIPIASCPMDATHFVADRFTRTMNMLETMALGKPVVTHLWLQSCAQASCLVDEKNYILRDAKKEKEFGFSMPVSLSHARQHPLLEGRKVLITPKVKPDKDRISSLVKAVGGQAIEKAQISLLKIPDLLILSCEEDEDICVPYLQKGVTVYSSELLLSGIIMQKLEYERHQLFTKYSRRNRRPRKM